MTLTRLCRTISGRGTNEGTAGHACLYLVGQRSIALSVASVWEMLIKSDLGKLTLTQPLREILIRQQANGISVLPVSLDHVLRLEAFPRPPKDPFDRLIAAQAAVEHMAMVSVDPIFAQYPVTVLW